MDCHKVMYKPYRTTTPYENYIKKKVQKQITVKKEFIYNQILKFRESRYPRDFLQQLEQQINPFQLSLEKLKEVFSKKYPQYSSQLVNQSVEHIFNRKCQESQMIKESAMIIQYGEEYIRNGRKLLKEDFTFDFSNYVARTPDNSTSRDREDKKRPRNPELQTLSQKQIKTDRLSTDRNLLTTDRNRSLTESPSKMMQFTRKTERFNQILQDELKKQKLRFQNLQEIQQGNNQDSVYYNQEGYTDRSRLNDSLPSFNEADLLVQPDIMETGRSQIQQLNFLLASVNVKEEPGTSRSRKSMQGLKINKQIKQSLYTVRGNLKLSVIKKAVQRLKKQQAEGRNS